MFDLGEKTTAEWLNDALHPDFQELLRREFSLATLLRLKLSPTTPSLEVTSDNKRMTLKLPRIKLPQHYGEHLIGDIRQQYSRFWGDEQREIVNRHLNEVVINGDEKAEVIYYPDYHLLVIKPRIGREVYLPNVEVSEE